MNRAAVSIPEKLFFKIGEVCDITDVQAHVLRYWESEFPMLAPQKNRAGQRTYRKRDVEMVLRIKELLYEDQYTIAGAKKKLTSELRGASKLKVVTPEMSANAPNASTASPPPTLNVAPATAPVSQSIEPTSAVTSSRANFDEVNASPASVQTGVPMTDERRAAIRQLRQDLHELLNLLDSTDTTPDTRRQ
ncbi:MAG TPA: MerR family transcriptional regulator [Pyrinomonadaceae bacterium]|jgi:DNA-binding transcriptional MerR regulator